MPNDAVTVAGRLVEAFNGHDADEIVRWASPEIVIVTQRSEIEGAFEGHEGARRWALGYWELAPDGRAVIEEVRETGPDTALVLGRQTGTARDGGPSFDAPLAMVIEVCDGLVTRMRAFRSHAEAIEATR